jgi:hypothetical protein
MKFAFAVVVLSGLMAGAQLVRPARVNPTIDPSHTIQAHARTATELVAVIDRACGDCHSNETVWSRYTQIAPLSWVIALSVREGRKTLNFSEWSAYPRDLQRKLLVQSCRATAAGRMPGRPYTLLRPEARLSSGDIAVFCAAAREADAAGDF